MKVAIPQDSLARALGIVSRAVPSRSPLPVVSNVLLTTDDHRLKLVATNLEIALTVWIGAQVSEEGTITVPARLFSEFVSQLKGDQPVQITLPPRSRQLNVHCGRDEANIGGMPADDFPVVPEVTDGQRLVLPARGLRRAIEEVVFAAARDDSRPVLTGVHVQVADGVAELAGADGFRLAVHRLRLPAPSAEGSPEPFSVNIPWSTLDHLGRLLSESGDVQMAVNGERTRALFRLDDIELVTQLIPGTFPNYQQLIPTTYATRARVSVEEFLHETKIAAIFARDGSGIVRLHVTPGEGGGPGSLQVSARADEVGDNRGEIDAAVDGEPSKIAFNSRYLIDVLSVLEPGELALETSGPSNPGVLRPLGHDDYVHVVMPMFVQW